MEGCPGEAGPRTSASRWFWSGDLISPHPGGEWWAAETRTTTLPKMSQNANPDRPIREMTAEGRKDSDGQTEVDPRSPASYLILAPVDTPWHEVARAHREQLDPAELWGQRINGHAVLERTVCRPDGYRTFFRCGRCDETTERLAEFRRFQCSGGETDG